MAGAAVRELLALIVSGTVGASVLMILPMLIGVLVPGLGISEAQAGALASIELGSVTIGGVIALFMPGRIPWRRILMIALAVLAVANLLSGLCAGYEPLILLRVVGGAASGVLLAIANAGLAQREQAERGFALFIVGQVAFGALFMWLVPSEVAAHGAGFAFFTLAAFAALSLGPALWLPPGRSVGEGDTLRQLLRIPRVSLLAVAAIFVFFAGQGGFWAYAERLGVHAGFAADEVAFALTITTVAGLVGALAAMALGTRLGRALPLLAGAALQIAVLLALLGRAGWTVYIVAVSGFNLCWNFLIPFQQGVLAALDPTGRTMMLAGIAIGGGLAAGPALTGALLDSGGDAVVSEVAIAGTVVSCAVLIVIGRRAPQSWS